MQRALHPCTSHCDESLKKTSRFHFACFQHEICSNNFQRSSTWLWPVCTTLSRNENFCPPGVGNISTVLPFFKVYISHHSSTPVLYPCHFTHEMHMPQPSHQCLEWTVFVKVYNAGRLHHSIWHCFPTHSFSYISRTSIALPLQFLLPSESPKHKLKQRFHACLWKWSNLYRFCITSIWRCKPRGSSFKTNYPWKLKQIIRLVSFLPQPSFMFHLCRFPSVTLIPNRC